MFYMAQSARGNGYTPQSGVMRKDREYAAWMTASFQSFLRRRNPGLREKVLLIFRLSRHGPFPPVGRITVRLGGVC